MNIIPDYQHTANHEELARLTALGFEFDINANGCFVKFKGEGIGGAGVVLPRSKPLRGNQAKENRRMFLDSALRTAKSSKFYKELSC